MSTHLALGILWLACAAVLGWLFYTAPWGWQDRNGYHDGKEDE